MTRANRAARAVAASFRTDRRGGVSTLGIVILVAMTVTVAAAPMVILKIDQSGADPVISGVQSAIAKGAGDWGDGDEVVEVAHRGGRIMEAQYVEVLIRVNGVDTVVAGPAGSADGESFATPGTPWKYQATIPEGADVEVQVIWQKLMTEQLVAQDAHKVPGVSRDGAHGNGHGHGHGHDDEDHDDQDHDEHEHDEHEHDDEGSEDEEGEKVTICHIPPGNPENRRTLQVGRNALQAHLDHGDHEGPCEE